MARTNIEMQKLLLSYLGEEKILELSNLFGNTPISFAGIKRYIQANKIKHEVIKHQSVNKAAKFIGVHRSTIYRQLKKKK